MGPPGESLPGEPGQSIPGSPGPRGPPGAPAPDTSKQLEAEITKTVNDIQKQLIRKITANEEVLKARINEIGRHFYNLEQQYRNLNINITSDVDSY